MKKLIKYLLQILLPKSIIIWRGSRSGKKIAITFDDGPNPLYTPKFIDVLHKYGIKATFFLSGHEVEKYPEIAKDLVRHGHSIGNHTYSHQKVFGISKSKIRDEIEAAQSIIQHVTGTRPMTFRPPWGRIGFRAIAYCARNRLPVVLWSVDSIDHARSGVQSILSKVNASNIKSGDIILFHDDNDYTLEALPVIIENLRDKYEFVTVEQMLKL